MLKFCAIFFCRLASPALPHAVLSDRMYCAQQHHHRPWRCSRSGTSVTHGCTVTGSCQNVDTGFMFVWAWVPNATADGYARLQRTQERYTAAGAEAAAPALLLAVVLPRSPNMPNMKPASTTLAPTAIPIPTMLLPGVTVTSTLRS